MTAILRNDGENGARSPENMPCFFKGRGLHQISGRAVKNKLLGDRNDPVLHICQLVKALTTQGFFAFAKFFQQVLDTSSCGDL